MPYQSGGAPPGLRGYLMSRQNQQVEQQQELQGLMGMLRLKQAQEEAAQRAQMQPLQMELMKAQVEAQREKARTAPQRAEMEAALNQMKLDKARREGLEAETRQAGLSGLLQQMTRPYQSPQGVAPTDGSQGAPDMVAPNDQAAIQALQAAGGRPMRVDVANPGLTQAYQVMANPQRAIPELIKQQRPPTAQSPIGKIKMDLAAGRISPQEAADAITKANTPGGITVNNMQGSAGFGTNPNTGKPGHYTIGKDGQLRWDEVLPLPKDPPLRAIPTPLANKLTEAAELADATARFSSTFKDGFAGKTLTGDLSNTTGKLFGDSTGQAQWWQDYELHQSQIRNKLFGSALTPAEIEAWNRSAINPRMAPSEIRKNLTRRNTLENSGLNRLMKGVAAGGYNKEQIEAFTGRSLDGVPQAPAAPGRQRLRFDAQGNLVQ
jgi:hypothetical protein